jgi:hypothetical protein
VSNDTEVERRGVGGNLCGQRGRGGIGSDVEQAERDSEEERGKGEACEAQEAAWREVFLRGQYLSEVGARCGYRAHCQSTINEGAEAKENGCGIGNEVGGERVIQVDGATDIFKDVEAVSLYDELEDDVERGEESTDERVDDDGAAFLTV